ncbi:MAG: phosphodiester glycosidase family protein [Armatimonadetes bacterium]|nr:phosphodiester glycosidase family protein [Armatimonadota bacterium]
MAGVTAQVITIDLNNPRVCIEAVLPASGGYGNFERMARRSDSVAAINGTFFDPPTAVIVCNLVAHGRLLAEGRAGNSLVVDLDGQARLVRTAGHPGRVCDWSRASFAVSGGPTLLAGGAVVLDPSPEGFRDPGLFRPAPRSALGVTDQNKLLMVTIREPIRLIRLAWAMKQLGARDALNLDGGSSSGLYYRGRVLHRPERAMTNLIVVRERAAPRSVEAVSRVP